MKTFCIFSLMLCSKLAGDCSEYSFPKYLKDDFYEEIKVEIWAKMNLQLQNTLGSPMWWYYQGQLDVYKKLKYDIDGVYGL